MRFITISAWHLLLVNFAMETMISIEYIHNPISICSLDIHLYMLGMMNLPTVSWTQIKSCSSLTKYVKYLQLESIGIQNSKIMFILINIYNFIAQLIQCAIIILTIFTKQTRKTNNCIWSLLFYNYCLLYTVRLF